MREWCSCGCSIRARRKDVLAWRTTHRHDGKEEPEPDKQGSMALTDLARPYFQYDGNYQDIPDVQARIGFQPNRSIGA